MLVVLTYEPLENLLVSIESLRFFFNTLDFLDYAEFIDLTLSDSIDDPDTEFELFISDVITELSEI